MSDGFENQDPMDAFEEVEGTYSPGEIRRAPRGGTCEKTGRVKLNLNASDDIRDLVKHEGHDPDSFKLVFGANEATKVVAAYVVGPNTLNSHPIRLNKDRTYTIYLHPVFAKYARLRLNGKLHIKVSMGVAKGKQCLLLDLNGLAKRTTPRGDESAS